MMAIYLFITIKCFINKFNNTNVLLLIMIRFLNSSLATIDSMKHVSLFIFYFVLFWYCYSMYSCHYVNLYILYVRTLYLINSYHYSYGHYNNKSIKVEKTIHLSSELFIRSYRPSDPFYNNSANSLICSNTYYIYTTFIHFILNVDLCVFMR